jgi:hypothetical protein
VPRRRLHLLYSSPPEGRGPRVLPRRACRLQCFPARPCHAAAALRAGRAAAAPDLPPAVWRRQGSAGAICGQRLRRSYQIMKSYLWRKAGGPEPKTWPSGYWPTCLPDAAGEATARMLSSAGAFCGPKRAGKSAFSEVGCAHLAGLCFLTAVCKHVEARAAGPAIVVLAAITAATWVASWPLLPRLRHPAVPRVPHRSRLHSSCCRPLARCLLRSLSQPVRPRRCPMAAGFGHCTPGPMGLGGRLCSRLSGRCYAQAVPKRWPGWWRGGPASSGWQGIDAVPAVTAASAVAMLRAQGVPYLAVRHNLIRTTSDPLLLPSFRLPPMLAYLHLPLQPLVVSTAPVAAAATTASVYAHAKPAAAVACARPSGRGTAWFCAGVCRVGVTSTTGCKAAAGPAGCLRRGRAPATAGCGRLVVLLTSLRRQAAVSAPTAVTAAAAGGSAAAAGAGATVFAGAAAGTAAIAAAATLALPGLLQVPSGCASPKLLRLPRLDSCCGRLTPGWLKPACSLWLAGLGRAFGTRPAPFVAAASATFIAATVASATAAVPA